MHSFKLARKYYRDSNKDEKSDESGEVYEGIIGLNLFIQRHTFVSKAGRKKSSHC